MNAALSKLKVIVFGSPKHKEIPFNMTGDISKCERLESIFRHFSI